MRSKNYFGGIILIIIGVAAILNNIFNFQTNSLQSTGIGIENTIKRLDILYPENYSYKHRTEEGKHYCELKINLK